MSRVSVNRAAKRDEKRSAKLAKTVPQMTAKRQARMYTKTGKHRAQTISQRY